MHLLLERIRDLRFVLTVSSARKLKRTGVDLLAGRAMVKSMRPFLAVEVEDSFRLESMLQLGMVPLITESSNPPETLKSYIIIYLREEVQVEGMMRNIGAFSRFLEAASSPRLCAEYFIRSSRVTSAAQDIRRLFPDF